MTFFTFCLYSCKDNDTKESSVELTVSKNHFETGSDGGSTDFYVQADNTLKVSSESEWCKVTREPYDSQKLRKFVISVGANTETSERNAVVSVETKSDRKEIKVSQERRVQIDTDNGDISAPVAGGVFELSITSKEKLSLDVKGESWISATVTNTDNGYRVDVNVGVNRRSEIRSGLINLIAGDIKKEIIVTQDAAQESAGMDMDALQLAKQIYLGWNLGNTLECVVAKNDGYAGSELAWGNPYTTLAIIQSIKAAGFSSVRIPVSWDVYSIDNNTHQIDPQWMARVKEVVDFVVDNDMYAMINIHWDGGWLENNCNADKKAENIVKQKAYWTQIANEFKHYDELLLFAGCNEPDVRTTDQMYVLKEYEQAFIDAVRATGGRNAKRNLIVQGPVTDISLTDQLMIMPTDNIANRLMLEVHYYEPWTFCGLTEDASWGKMAYLWGEGFSDKATGELKDRWTGDCDEKHMHNQFRKMKEKFVDKGIPVIIGEFGVTYRKFSDPVAQKSHDDSRAYYYSYITEQAKNYGLVPYVWDNGGDMGVVNRHLLTTNNLMNSLIKGADAGTYPY